MSKTSQRRRDNSFRLKKFYEAGLRGERWPFPSANKKEVQEHRRGCEEFWERKS